jgi:hypothetical protein
MKAASERLLNAIDFNFPNVRYFFSSLSFTETLESAQKQTAQKWAGQKWCSQKDHIIDNVTCREHYAKSLFFSQKFDRQFVGKFS